MRSPDFLQTLWFGLIAVLWIGYFILEGFDFGVGMLLRLIGRTRAERRALIHTIGPVWDGNEVWLLVAGGATFAAFPGWYASLFSGFYLALLLILIALILRGVSFEFWGKFPGERWRTAWEFAAIGGSALASLLWGVAFADIVHGVPMNAAHNVTGTIFSLLTPYALLGGLTTLSLFIAHGAIFLGLRTTGLLRERAHDFARKASAAAIAPLTAFLLWTALDQRAGGVKLSATVLAAGSVLAAVCASGAVRARREGWAFTASALAIGLLFAALLTWLFPDALPSSSAAADSLRLVQASSASYTLSVMSVVALVFVPVILAYQAWTYWVFRHRLGAEQFDGAPTPLAVLAEKLGGPDAPGTGPHAPLPPAGRPRGQGTWRKS